MEPFVSATCEGERCHCGKPAAKKVGEEIPFDDPVPARHSLTAYVCADHYAELMGPLGAKQVSASIPTPEASEQLQDMGASATPSGSRATHETPAGSHPSGFDPSRGEWLVWPCVNRLGHVTSYDIHLPQDPGAKGVAVVASVWGTFAEARLMAAAPRMFAALEKALADATGSPTVWFFDAKDAIAAATAPDADLRAFGFAHGTYENICIRCNEHFIGAKNAPRCRRCAYVLLDCNSAIATEARRAETPKSGSVHEGAGPKDIAHE